MRRQRSEQKLEERLRKLIKSEVIEKHRHVSILDSKALADIIICRNKCNGEKPAIFFLELKVKKQHRMGIGGAKGKGIQPEIVQKNPQYLGSHFRWVIRSDERKREFLFVSTRTVKKYLMGGSVDKKHNNIQHAIFDGRKKLSEKQLLAKIRAWLLNT